MANSTKTTSQNNPEVPVAAVIVTYNRLALLKECLEALTKQTTKLKTIYVVNNASTDGTDVWMQQRASQSKSQIHYLSMEQNLGGAAGFEYGLRQINLDAYDWVWIMDDDSIAQPSALEQLLNLPSAKDSAVGVMCSKVVDPAGGLVNVPAMFDWTFGKTHPIPLASFDQAQTKVDAATFVGFFVRTKVIRKVGYPKGDYFIQSDDFEYSLRIRQAGYKILLISSSLILHKITVIKEKTQQGDYIPASELWKYYYLLRNEILSLSLYLPTTISRWRFYLWHIYRATKNSFKIMTQDHKHLRLKIEWWALMDGILRRSGKRLDPVKFKQRLVGETQ